MLSIYPQATGEAGIRQTLAKIKSFVHLSMLDPAIRDQAAFAISGCPKGDTRCHCAALLSWVNRKVQYVPDPQAHELSYELVHDPRLMARAIHGNRRVYGDCDDMAGYLSALLASIGRKPILRAVGYDGRPFSHVYVCCEGLTLDPTRDAWNFSLRHHSETSVLEERV